MDLRTLLRSSSDRTTGINEEDERIQWLRSQLIGRGAEFDTPFGKRVLTYADHTASGRCLRYVEDYIVEHVLPFYGNTHTSDSFVGNRTATAVHEAMDYIKRCMGAGGDDKLIFCGSGATSSIKRLQEIMGVSIPSITRRRVWESLRDEERWVVFVGPHEHHSNLLSWRQSLAEVVEIGADEDGLVDMGALRAELEDPRHANRPMLGSFSACSNVTGVISDTRAIARLLHEHGAFACFDFAASGPYVEIDMRSGHIEGYDAIFLSPHKFVGGPGSSGILLMNKCLYRLGEAPPSTCGGGTVAYVNGFDERDTLYYDDIEEREDAGTPPIIQKIRAALAFWVKEYIGHDLIDLCEGVHVAYAMKRLLPNPSICVLGDSGARRLPIVSFLVFPNVNSIDGSDDRYGYMCGNRWKMRGRPLNGRFVAKLLNDLFGIQARGGCSCAGPYGHHLLGVDDALSLAIRDAIHKGYNGLKPGWTRISFPYYMHRGESEFILDCIEFVAAYGHRFLPLYQFDWATGDWTFRKRASRYHIAREDVAFAPSDSSPTRDGGGGWIQRGPKKDEVCKDRFMGYLESARRIALSLPDEHHQTAGVPEGIDQRMVLFRL